LPQSLKSPFLRTPTDLIQIAHCYWLKGVCYLQVQALENRRSMINNSDPTPGDFQIPEKRMNIGDRKSLRSKRLYAVQLLALVPLWLCMCGCLSIKPHVSTRLKKEPQNLAKADVARDQYRVQCPDVLEVTLNGSPGGVWQYRVDLDGRIECGTAEGVRIEGQTTTEIATNLERCLHLKPGQIGVRVAQYESQHIYLYGQVNGPNRPVPYEGPESVVGLLQRVGGITKGAADGDIHVIRSHVTDGKAPEVFDVKLEDILKRQDEASNITLQPFDQVYVGQSRKSLLQSSIPPVFRPLYELIFGLNQSENKDK
jgi:protein involved in polysaccharide export with SLBB domain